jgi:hypothetical protein
MTADAYPLSAKAGRVEKSEGGTAGGGTALAHAVKAKTERVKINFFIFISF